MGSEDIGYRYVIRHKKEKFYLLDGEYIEWGKLSHARLFEKQHHAKACIQHRGALKRIEADLEILPVVLTFKVVPA